MSMIQRLSWGGAMSFSRFNRFSRVGDFASEVHPQFEGTNATSAAFEGLYRTFQRLTIESSELHDWFTDQLSAGDLPREVEEGYQRRSDALLLELAGIGNQLCEMAAPDADSLRIKAAVLRYLLPEEPDVTVRLAASLCCDLSR